MQKKTKKQSDKDTLAEVTKEMAKPRVAKSARAPSTMFQSKAVGKSEKY